MFKGVRNWSKSACLIYSSLVNRPSLDAGLLVTSGELGKYLLCIWIMYGICCIGIAYELRHVALKSQKPGSSQAFGLYTSLQ